MTTADKLIAVAENVPKVYEAGERNADEIITRTVTEYSNDRVESIGNYAFSNCTALTTTDFSAATSIGNNVFEGCSVLTTVDFPVATSIGGAVFYNCTALTAVILRNNTICTLSNTNAFTGCTHITGTGGYIYVPSSLIDTYKTATNWVTYASKFRALEDYTVDGTTTGVLDESKVSA